jgi:hypothetical protein
MIAHDKFTALAPVPATESARVTAAPGDRELVPSRGFAVSQDQRNTFRERLRFRALRGLRLEGSTAADCQQISVARTQIPCLPSMVQRLSIA